MMEFDWIFLLWFILGMVMNELSRYIKVKITEEKWECPYCNMCFRANDKEVVLRVKDVHLRQHIS